MQTAYDLRNINLSLPMPKRKFLKRSNTANLKSWNGLQADVRQAPSHNQDINSIAQRVNIRCFNINLFAEVLRNLK